MELKDKILEAIQTEMQSQTIADINREVQAAESIVKICDDEMTRLIDFIGEVVLHNSMQLSTDELLQLFKQNQ